MIDYSKMPLAFPYFTYNSYNLMSPNVGEHFPTPQNLGELWACFHKNNESKMRVTLVQMQVITDIDQFPSPFLNLCHCHANRPGLRCGRMRDHINQRCIISTEALLGQPPLIFPASRLAQLWETLSTCTLGCLIFFFTAHYFFVYFIFQ